MAQTVGYCHNSEKLLSIVCLYVVKYYISESVPLSLRLGYCFALLKLQNSSPSTPFS